MTATTNFAEISPAVLKLGWTRFCADSAAGRAVIDNFMRAKPGGIVEVPSGLRVDALPLSNPHGFDATEMALWQYTAGYLQEFRT